MKYKKTKISSNEYLIASIQDDLSLYTVGLEEEIAYTIFSFKLQKVGLARSLNRDQLFQFFAEFNPDNIKESGLITTRIVGGNDSEISKDTLKNLLKQLNAIDGGNNIINIKSCDTCDKIHPNSFEIDCYHGGIRAIDSVNND